VTRSGFVALQRTFGNPVCTN